jgi:hypothetical protein
MWLYTWLFEENPLLAFAFGLAVFVECIVAIFACKKQTAGAVFGVGAAVVGIFGLALSGMSATQNVLFRGVGCLLVFTGILYLFCLGIIAAWRKKQEKQRAIEMRNKRLEYVLPDRDNSFVRARLNTVLRVGEQEECSPQGEFRFAHARKLLTAIKQKSLSMPERLQVQDMEKLFYAYLQKDSLRAEEVQLLSDTFAALIKLAAKHSL